MATNHELNTKNDDRQTRGVAHSTNKGHRSLFCLSEDNILRRSAEFIVNTKYPFRESLRAKMNIYRE